MASSKQTTEVFRRGSSRGAVVLLAMVFILLLSLVAATVLQSAIFQLHMAGNDQFLEEAIYRAQAIAAEVSLNPGSFSLAGGVGDTNCPEEDEAPECHRNHLRLPSSANDLEEFALSLRVTRQDPLLLKGFPFRESEDAVSSSNSFDAAIFEIDVRLNGSGVRLGSARIVQGIAVRVPAFR